MGRLLAIDYGQKRCGLAVSDPLKIIANGLDTVPTASLMDWLKIYLEKEEVERVIIGYPKTLSNEAAESVRFINPFIKKLKQQFPALMVDLMDERFTSKMAFQAMIDGGLKKKARQDKAMVDKVSAVIILQSWMESAQFRENR